jgi:hypothetical protein
LLYSFSMSCSGNGKLFVTKVVEVCFLHNISYIPKHRDAFSGWFSMFLGRFGQDTVQIDPFLIYYCNSSVGLLMASYITSYPLERKNFDTKTTFFTW